MDMDTIVMLALVTALVLVVAMVSMHMSARESQITGDGDESTDFLDESMLRCGICFGGLGGTTAVCGCGRRFHDSCAEPTGSCPYCGSGYSGFETFTDSRKACPNCGRYPIGNVCECGAVLPRNGEFTCICGEALNDGETVCRSCGAEYVMMEG